MSPTMRRRLMGLLVAIVVMAGCVVLGRWQWTRHTDREARISQIEANYDQTPVSFDTLVPDIHTKIRADTQWRPVTISGTYGEPVIKIRNRPLDGTHGYHLAIPFKTDDGVVLVQRGFIPIIDGEDPAIPPAPPGEVELTARIRPAEPADERSAPPGQGV